MKLHITHTTDYRYTEPLRYALQTLWLTPQSGAGQTVNFWSVGAPEKLYPQRDAFGNSIDSYTFVGKISDNVRWSLVNAAGQVDTLGVAEFVTLRRCRIRISFCALPIWPNRMLSWRRLVVGSSARRRSPGSST